MSSPISHNIWMQIDNCTSLKDLDALTTQIIEKSSVYILRNDGKQVLVSYKKKGQPAPITAIREKFDDLLKVDKSYNKEDINTLSAKILRLQSWHPNRGNEPPAGSQLAESAFNESRILISNRIKQLITEWTQEEQRALKLGRNANQNMLKRDSINFLKGFKGNPELFKVVVNTFFQTFKDSEQVGGKQAKAMMSELLEDFEDWPEGIFADEIRGQFR